MKKNCPEIMESFINAELHCTGGGLNQDSYNWSEDDEEVSRFTDIEDFIKAAKFVEPIDMLASFWFDNEIDIGKMKNLWKPKLHIVRGFCYTFQSKEAPVFMGDDDILNEKLSSLVLELDVSLIFLIY